MNFHKTSFFRFLTLAGFLACVTLSAQAQATRTWVSGVGDDANPCSRTAPCKTFAGAISKTAANGEINLIDPGGFGAVTITKSITIDASNVLGGIVVSGANGITISDGGSSTIVVTLRGLDMNGLNLGTNGIRIIHAKTVNIQNSVIFGFTNAGISDERTLGGNLLVTDSTIRNNGAANVSISGASTPSLFASLDNVRLLSSVTGLSVTNGNSAMISRSFLLDNTTQGILANGALTEVGVENCIFANNNVGISVKTGTPVVRVSNANFAKNGTNIKPGSGQILSYLNNKSSGNGVENAFSGPISQQ
jgi:hypothetical protein